MAYVSLFSVYESKLNGRDFKTGKASKKQNARSIAARVALQALKDEEERSVEKERANTEG